MKIILAEHAGFCFGVKRAVDAIEHELREGHEVWTIGMPIHNPQEVSRLQAMGLKVADNAGEIPSGAKVMIRAHGETLEVIDVLRKKCAEIEDMTCPFVKKAQNFAAELSREGWHIVLLGDKNHPEIKGILGHAADIKNAEVILNEDEAARIKTYGKIALISQTTQREEKLSGAAAVLVSKCSQLHVCNTICKATAERQNAVRELVINGKVDGVILIGGKTSANTGKLKDIIEAGNVSVLWAEDADELERNKNWFMGKNTIGIAAGASTPAWLIDKIMNNIA